MTALKENERLSDLSQEQLDIHRMIASIIDEFDAIGLYQQRVALTDNLDFKEALKYVESDEYEHVSMLIECLRRQVPELDKQLRKFLFSDEPNLAKLAKSED